jgi:hypothetical protein
LEELQLNFTDLDAEQLKVVSELSPLKVLAISGNEIDPESSKNLAKMTHLKKLYLWQTGLSIQEQETIQKSLPETGIDFGFDGKGIIYELNNPIISQAKMIYQDSLELSISHPIKTAEIRYTLDGSEPDSISSPIYSNPIFVKNTGKMLAKAYAADWKGSGSSDAIFMRSGISPVESKLINEPNPRYKASGTATLFDLEKAEAPNHGQKWLGYQDDPMIVEVGFETKSKNPKNLSISLLYNEGADIFPPAKITIDGLINGQWQQLASTTPSPSSKASSARSELLNFELATTDYAKLKITLTPLTKLPSWHPAAGSKGWVFADEIIFNE